MMRTCAICGISQPLTQFSTAPSKPFGKDYRCKTCAAVKMREWRKNNPEKHREHVSQWRRQNPKKVAEYARNFRQRNPEITADRALRDNYGIPIGTYATMFTDQNGKCGICGTTEPQRINAKRLAVDHCHDTGRIRGLLCHRCNSGIGYFNHDQKLLQAAIDYLSRT